MDYYKAFINARQIVEDYWAQGEKTHSDSPFGIMCPTGGFCLWTALHEALGDTGDVFDFIHLMGFKCSEEVWEWNDENGRTKEEVLARIDAALYVISIIEGLREEDLVDGPDLRELSLESV